MEHDPRRLLHDTKRGRIFRIFECGGNIQNSPVLIRMSPLRSTTAPPSMNAEHWDEAESPN
jgi:hypothetical protein